MQVAFIFVNNYYRNHMQYSNLHINYKARIGTLQLNFLIFQKKHRQSTMDKHTWRQVKANSSTSLKPSSRWGHSCCVVNQEIVFFGGYADSNYMNDIWSFNTITMKWKQIQTFGDIPSNRSNCSMNYDKENNQIVIFGGGGPNKQRFNSISILDWSSKTWIQISPKQNQSGPWERTYHSAQLLYPYLIVYGGEGVADMDDLWVFSFINLSWSQVQLDKNKNRPCARRFHSSAVIGNQFFVIAGCHGKYRCLSDIYSMDFTSLLQTGSFDHLQWTERKLKGTSFLSRWGHSSAVFDKKIYIFGGRFSNDLNDLLVADFQTNTLKTIKTGSEVPQARRRHCSGFIGSSMLMFGGFNGAYFQDLYYIDVMQSRGKTENNISSWKIKNQQMQQFVKNTKNSDFQIITKEGIQFPIFLGLIAKNFNSYVDMINCLQQINQKFSLSQLEDCFEVLYQGFGQLKLDQQLTEKYFSNLPKNLQQKLGLEKQKVQKMQKQVLKKAVNSNNSVLKVGKEQFQNYMITMREQQYEDAKLQIESWSISINRNLLMAKSKFFAGLLVKQNSEAQMYKLRDILKSNQNSQSSYITYQILINYIYSDLLVLPSNVSEETLIDLTLLSDYFCLPRLKNLCEIELISLVNQQNASKMLKIASLINCQNLLTNCSDIWIKKMCQNRKIVNMKEYISEFKFSPKQSEKLLKIYQIVRFDLMQSNLQNQKLGQPNFKKKSQSSISMQKENFQANVYSQ